MKSGASKVTYMSSATRRVSRAAFRAGMRSLLCLIGVVLTIGCSLTTTIPVQSSALLPLTESRATRNTLESAAMDATVPFVVYLPSGYSTNQKYPVWYAMHGYSSTENWWIEIGAGDRADALIQAGDLDPMIMVFPLTRYDDAKTIEADMADGVRGPSRMEQFLCDELIPFIDEHYSTIASAKGRSIGGFSMGGLFALQIGLHQPQLFSKIGAYSPALTYQDFSGDHFDRWLFDTIDSAPISTEYATLHGMDQLLIYLDCGGERDPFSVGASSLNAALLQRGISVSFHPHDGGHSLDATLLDDYLLFYGASQLRRMVS